MIAEYRALAYRGVTPTSKLETDNNGYSRCIVGAFDTFTRNGPYYPATDTVKRIFSDSSAFMQRVREGNSHGELGHPKIEGMSLMQIITRLAHIEDTNICVHHRDFVLEEGKDEFGKKIILVYSWLKPSGPYADSLDAQLKNRDENVCFSVRSYTNTTFQGNITVKEISNIVTYDKVNEPGMKITNKLDTLSANADRVIGLEELSDNNILFTSSDLNGAIARSSTVINSGLESDHSRLVHIRDSLGWNKVQVVHPSFMNWDSILR